MCSGLMRLTLCLGLLTMTSACDRYSPTGPSPFRPVTNPSPSPAPTPTPNPNPVPVPPGGIPTTTISVGEVIHASIGLDDPICDPGQWDARAPCKLFHFTPTQSGTLHLMLTAMSLPSGSHLDVVDLMLFEGLYYVGVPQHYSERALSVPVVEGKTYTIRINSYPYLLPPPGNLDFELKTEM